MVPKDPVRTFSDGLQCSPQPAPRSWPSRLTPTHLVSGFVLVLSTAGHSLNAPFMSHFSFKYCPGFIHSAASTANTVCPQTPNPVFWLISPYFGTTQAAFCPGVKMDSLGSAPRLDQITCLVSLHIFMIAVIIVVFPTQLLKRKRFISFDDCTQ